jgi:photosystem II stability/assembly factor-like uncharacterized protein
MAIVKRNQAVIWSNAQNGKFGGYDTLGIGRYGAEDATLPGAGQDTTYVQDENGNPFLAVLADTPPGGPPSFTMNFFEEYSKNYLRTARERGTKIGVQHRFHRYGVLSNPIGWTKLFHYGGGIIGDETRSGPQIDYSGEGLRGSMPVNFKTAFEYIRPELTALDLPDVVADALDVYFIGSILKDVTAYPGPDQVGFVAMQAAAGVAAKLYVTSDGGSTWSAADADPFGADEDIVSVRAFVINPQTGGRVVVQNGDAAEVAWADFNWSDPTALTWTTVATTGNGKKFGWRYFKELLIATASGVFVSQDAGESIASTLSSNANITGFTFTPDDPDIEPYAYAFGASNTLLRKLKGSNSVDTLVGPAGGGAFTSLAVCNDGTLWAGNGTSIYRSSDGGTTAAGWTAVKDFGSGMAVVGIGPVKNDPEFLQVVVDDSAPGDGTVWITADGVTFEEITTPANDGLNAVHFSQSDQLAIVVGDDDATEPLIFKLAA